MYLVWLVFSGIYIVRHQKEESNVIIHLKRKRFTTTYVLCLQINMLLFIKLPHSFIFYRVLWVQVMA